MRKIVLIQESLRFAGDLNKLPAVSTGAPGQKQFLNLGEEPHPDAVDLSRRGFVDIRRKGFDQEYRDHFLREYVEVIGQLDVRLSSHRWWGTDISSKNRFTSPLAPRLQQFVWAIEAIKNPGFELLIILNIPWTLLSVLATEAKRAGVAVEVIASSKVKYSGLIKGFVRRVGSILYDSWLIFSRSRLSRQELSERLKELNPDKAYFVFKTFIYNHSFKDGRYHDVFFGGLPEFVKKSHPVVFISFVFGDYLKCIRAMRDCASSHVFPIETFLSLVDILRGAWDVLTYRVHLNERVDFLGYDVRSLINGELERTFCKIPLYHYLHFASCRNFFKRISVAEFILTYENNPWEKMCMLAVRQDEPQAKIVGYQHTVVPHSSANMFFSRYDHIKIPRPDRIVTVGSTPKEIMERYGHFNSVEIVPSCGLRFEYLFNLPLGPRRLTRNVLLILEGVPDIYRMVNYVLAQLNGRKGYHILVRTHPTLPLAAFVDKLAAEFKEGRDFILSKNLAMKDDIEWADVVIYWGSTGALEALSIGKPVIHFDMGSILSFDPLFECHDFKWTVKSADDLPQLIERIRRLSDAEYQSARIRAKSYLNKYFLPITDRAMSAFILADDRKV